MGNRERCDGAEQTECARAVSADATAGWFPVAVYDRAKIKGGVLMVRFKTISGSVEQAAGLVWGCRDAQNYYIVRANALEDNAVLYKGERLALAPLVCRTDAGTRASEIACATRPPTDFPARELTTPAFWRQDFTFSRSY